MKKIFLALSFAALLASTAFANPISVGNMNVYNFGDIKLHAYSTGDNMNDHCYVVETPEGLVLIESTAYKENVQALSDYIKSLEKPLAAALLSYHPNGYKSYGDVKIYATENALKSWQENGGVWNLTQSFIQALGDKVAEDLPETAEIVEEGQKDVAEKIEYLEKVLELAKTSKTKDEFISAVKAAFPDYAVDAYLEMSANALF